MLNAIFNIRPTRKLKGRQSASPRLSHILHAPTVFKDVCVLWGLKHLGSVARKVDNFIHRIVTFSNFLNMFSNCYNLDKKSLFLS